MQWGVKIALAENYEQVGTFLSAYEVLKSVKMDEKAIKCLYLGGRQTQAIEMATELLKTTKGLSNYNLMCLMGEMKRDHTFWEKAWE